MNSRECILCSNHHPLYLCGVFSKLSINDKDKEVRRHQLCRNCLRKGHRADDCPSSSTCRKCHGHHHTQLCSNSSSTFPSANVPESTQLMKIRAQSTDNKPPMSMSAAIVETSVNASSGRGVKSVVLATAIVLVVDDNGIGHHARALLDSGSECCFATESFIRRLKIQRQKINLPIAGIGQRSTHVRFKIVSTVRSLVTDYSAPVDFVILPRVTVDLPSNSFDVSSWKIPTGIQLADPLFHQTAPIDIILGAELFFDLFKASGRIQLDSNGPLFVNSVFGWIVSGRKSTGQSSAPASVNIATVVDLHQQMEKFWTVEEDSGSANYSVEEAACEEHFQRNVCRNSEGRYIVRLPVRNDILSKLEDNRRTAIRRFRLLENRLWHNENLRKQYCDFLEEYRALGHMHRVYDHETAPSPSYHLPHHCVVRDDSSTTKLRVVFDASCKTPSGPSLNDALMVGSVTQEDIRSIIMRSRIRPIMIIADIKQMYRQILVDEKDIPLQRIVWRFSPDDPLETYELRTVTYGTASAPFLTTRVLQQLAEDELYEYPQAATVLERDFYVDDLFSGADSVQEAIALRQQLEFLLNKGGFQLRKWASNEPAVLEEVSLDNRALQASVDFDRDSCIKTLGLHWEPSTDNLRYKIELPNVCEERLTKRIALSQIARLFDPLGLVGPIVTTAKLFMQALWTLKDSDDNVLGWDQELPPPMIEHWASYLSQLLLLNELRIPRYVLFRNPTTVQLHIFSDASERAYGTCAYLRSTNSDGTINVALLTAKSKVAPLKKQSIPRLELCGALLASQLYEKITASLQLSAETFFWVDSTVVLSWLNSTPSTWTTFVANRQQNPADCISRGTTAELLFLNELWWSGPFWLQQHSSSWPIQQHDELEPSDAQLEIRKTPVASVPAIAEPTFLDLFVEKFSSYDRMLRVLAYCQRFRHNCLARPRPKRSSLSSDEVSKAEKTLISLVQQQCFNSDWTQLQQGKPISAKSPLRWFHPFLAPDGLIHIGGRLERSQQPFEVKHPILLPSSHRFSLLLVRGYHHKHLHAATQLLLTIIRLCFWITGARKLAKAVVHNCTICYRVRPKHVEQFMFELPASRVTVARPFSVSGVDYWGPILLKPVSRKAAPRKAYVAVFICFSTKVVHLELVPDFQALRRFVSQRGICSEIHSDNGRNFVGAANELRRLFRNEHHQQAVEQECMKNGIRWCFNPPKASNFGGLWEAAIASAQKHFYRVLGPNKLADDDMQTLLKQIECCLNSRPLVPLSDDLTDFQPLTPGHFLIGSAMKAIPDMDLTKIPSNRLRHWEHTQKLFQHLWQRWHNEYLSTLQPRSKWCNPPVVIEKGRLVVIKDENTPPVHWPTGRIIELHPGADGITRVVTLQTPSGKFVRPVSKICLLPIATTQPTTPSEEPTKTTEL
ncbi:uncharacterized protein LOC129773180 [Toxorhynchites rutilus septentrionalis]|uniref:uncharacterized protein LOC129773180 n=1 Tax=Toxorhynchites rutilus septentrionalis TaxID=329112 RepID=UPI00247869DF|nr:uncharacterized protein LOC129773180 [Toxorhynchites rutilus septentrionalis]